MHGNYHDQEKIWTMTHADTLKLLRSLGRLLQILSLNLGQALSKDQLGHNLPVQLNDQVWQVGNQKIDPLPRPLLHRTIEKIKQNLRKYRLHHLQAHPLRQILITQPTGANCLSDHQGSNNNARETCRLLRRAMERRRLKTRVRTELQAYPSLLQQDGNLVVASMRKTHCSARV